MSIENYQPGSNKSRYFTSPTAAASAAALFGLVSGTISGGLAFGIVIAVILGIQAAISAAFGRKADSMETTGTPCSSSTGHHARSKKITEII